MSLGGLIRPLNEADEAPAEQQLGAGAVDLAKGASGVNWRMVMTAITIPSTAVPAVSAGKRPKATPRSGVAATIELGDDPVRRRPDLAR